MLLQRALGNIPNSQPLFANTCSHLRPRSVGGTAWQYRARAFSFNKAPHRPLYCQASASSMSDTPVKDAMEHKIGQELKPVRLHIEDESHKHAGHAAMKGLNRAETHFNLSVVSEAFEGLTTIKRHKLVYKVLADELAGPVHALSLKTQTPAEAS